MKNFKANCLSRKKGKAELIVLLVYAAGLIIVSCFHEPWFDEAQAWLIAKSASYKDMLTLVPHYEGHPPLWYLILSPFAKLGAPYELSLKAVNITICVGAIAVLLFKSPFPKIVNCVLPFTYFFFYQYGIVSRPYCITMLAMFLAAMYYKSRNERPGRYILSLMLLCLSCAFGIIIAGGLCIVWTFEILAHMKREHSLSRFYSDKRFWWLCAILLLAIILFIEIIPAEDVYYGGMEETLLSLLTKMSTYKFFLFVPFDSWSGVVTGYGMYSSIPSVVILNCICGAAFWVVLISVTRKNRKFLTFFIPYFLMISFMNFKYFAGHHLGISSLFHVFIFWIMADSEGGIEVPEFMKKFISVFKSKLIRRLSAAGGIIIGLLPVVYSGVCVFTDIREPYSMACYADFIKKNHIDDKKLMSGWNYSYLIEKDSQFKYIFMEMAIPSSHPEITENMTSISVTMPTILPYFDRNIFMNYNVDNPEQMYMTYAWNNDAEETLEKWRAKGLPDFILGYCPIDEIYSEDELDGVKYVVIEEKIISQCFKLDSFNVTVRMYMREDLLDEYPQFEPLYDPVIAG